MVLDIILASETVPLVVALVLVVFTVLIITAMASGQSATEIVMENEGHSEDELDIDINGETFTVIQEKNGYQEKQIDEDNHQRQSESEEPHYVRRHHHDQEQQSQIGHDFQEHLQQDETIDQEQKIRKCERERQHNQQKPPQHHQTDQEGLDQHKSQQDHTQPLDHEELQQQAASAAHQHQADNQKTIASEETEKHHEEKSNTTHFDQGQHNRIRVPFQEHLSDQDQQIDVEQHNQEQQYDEERQRDHQQNNHKEEHQEHLSDQDQQINVEQHNREQQYDEERQRNHQQNNQKEEHQEHLSDQDQQIDVEQHNQEQQYDEERQRDHQQNKHKEEHQEYQQKPQLHHNHHWDQEKYNQNGGLDKTSELQAKKKHHRRDFEDKTEKELSSGSPMSSRNEDELLEKQTKKQMVLKDKSSNKEIHQPERKPYETGNSLHKKGEQDQGKENNLNHVSSNCDIKEYNEEEQRQPLKLNKISSHGVTELKDIPQQDGYLNDKRENGAEKVNFTEYDLVSVLVEKRFFQESLQNIMEIGNVNIDLIMEIVKENSHIFYIERENVVLNPPILLCDQYCYQRCPNKELCQDLHICNEYIFGKCNEKSCMLGHRWNTNHNIKILEYFKIAHLLPPILVKLVSTILTGNYDEVNKFRLNICDSYNSISCKNNNCTSLHICHELMNSRRICKKEKCPLNHNILEDSCINILKVAGISTNESPIDILNSIKIEMENMADSLRNTTTKIKDANGKTNYHTNNMNQKEETNYQPSYHKRSKTVWDFFEYGDVAVEEICYYSVEGICRFEDRGCTRLHCDNHFHWQVSKNGINWINFQQHQSEHLEQQYCDPLIEVGNLTSADYRKDGDAADILKNKILRGYQWKVDFLDMKIKTANKSRFLRRLCSEKKKFPEVPSHTFIWYCLIDGKYVCIDALIKKKEFNSKYQEISDLIESKYQKFVKIGKQKIMCFKDLSFYINFEKMEVNITHNKTAIEISRRPLIDKKYFRK